MRRRQILAATPLLVSLCAIGKDETKFNGFWELGVPDKGSAPSKKVVMLKQSGSTLNVKDLGTGKDYSGSIDAVSIKFSLDVKDSASERPIKVMFEGSLKDGVLQGQTEVEGLTQKWTATPLTSLWLCSNHDPNHFAKTKEDMLKLTNEHKCAGWHRVLSSGS